MQFQNIIDNPVAIAAPSIPIFGIKIELNTIFSKTENSITDDKYFSFPDIVINAPTEPAITFITCAIHNIIKAFSPPIKSVPNNRNNSYLNI